MVSLTIFRHTFTRHHQVCNTSKLGRLELKPSTKCVCLSKFLMKRLTVQEGTLAFADVS